MTLLLLVRGRKALMLSVKTARTSRCKDIAKQSCLHG